MSSDFSFTVFISWKLSPLLHSLNPSRWLLQYVPKRCLKPLCNCWTMEECGGGSEQAPESGSQEQHMSRCVTGLSMYSTVPVLINTAGLCQLAHRQPERLRGWVTSVSRCQVNIANAFKKLFWTGITDKHFSFVYKMCIYMKKKLFLYLESVMSTKKQKTKPDFKEQPLLLYVDTKEPQRNWRMQRRRVVLWQKQAVIQISRPHLSDKALFVYLGAVPWRTKSKYWLPGSPFTERSWPRTPLTPSVRGSKNSKNHKSCSILAAVSLASGTHSLPTLPYPLTLALCKTKASFSLVPSQSLCTWKLELTVLNYLP